MDIDALAKQFSDFYYNTFDSDRTQLTNLYVTSRLSLSPFQFVRSFVRSLRPPLSLSLFPFILSFTIDIITAVLFSRGQWD